MEVPHVFTEHLLILLAEDPAEAVVDREGLVVIYEFADWEIYQEQERNYQELEGFYDAIFDDEPSCSQFGWQPWKLKDKVTDVQEGT